MEKVEALGGSVQAIDAGFIQREIEESAFAFHRRLQTKQDILVGVNDYVDENETVDVEILKIDPETERNQVDRLKRFKEDRDQEVVAARLDELRETRRGRREPPLSAEGGAARPRDARRGLRRDARGVRRVQAARLVLQPRVGSGAE